MKNENLDQMVSVDFILYNLWSLTLSKAVGFSCMWDSTYKRFLAANKTVANVVSSFTKCAP